jgi:gamma-glutamyltranspeptidase/glutathione hydrolase
MLRTGGNAVDAILASAIALTVVEPMSNGMGSDAFAIVWDGEQLQGLNGSGQSPAAWTPDRFHGQKAMPEKGWDCVTVPGAVDAWVKLSERYGKLPFEQLFGPAIQYASSGYAVTPIIADTWSSAAETYRDNPEFCRTFLPGGQSPNAGDRFRCPAQAETLAEIAESRGESFYRGRLAECIATASELDGGAMTQDDLATHESLWVDCISQDFGNLCIHEIPPNGQGLAALIALGILDRLQIDQYPPDSADSVHLQIEAMKVGFAEAHRHIADPAAMEAKVKTLLDPDQLARRAAAIKVNQADFPVSQVSADRGTVYLCAADQSGMMVSFIQSGYDNFGSGIVIPETGISMQSRGNGFTLDNNHPNRVDGRKRPFHTIIPAFATRAGQPLLAFGVMGKHMQPQGHVQVLIRMFCQERSPQQALDAPRWYVAEDFSICLEPDLDHLNSELSARGHRFMTPSSSGLFGGGQIILRSTDGYIGGSDPRKDGHAAGF